MEEKTAKKSGVFGTLWFVCLLLTTPFFGLMCYDGMILVAHGINPHNALYVPIIAYVVLTTLWVILKKKDVFPVKWVILSLLPLLLQLVPAYMTDIVDIHTYTFMWRFVCTFGGWHIINFVSSIGTLILWLVYGLSQMPKEADISTGISTTVPMSTTSAPEGTGERIVLTRGMFFNLFRITVTTKRVIYKGIFWRRMNMPLKHISAVDTAIFGTLHVGSSAGHIIMGFFRHYREVYDTINALLAQME